MPFKTRILCYWCILGVLTLVMVAHSPTYEGYAQELEVQVDNTPPQFTYTGTANNSDIEWEIGGAFTASWVVDEEHPEWYFIYWNQSGSNVTYTSGTYSDEETVSGQYDPGVSDIGNTIFFQVYANDTVNHANSSIVFFTVTNTNPPTIQVNRPENATYTGGQIEIWLSSPSYDLAVMWWALYYSNDTLREGNETWTEIVTRTLPDGQYYLIGYCNDTASLSSKLTVYFTMSLALVVQGPGVVEPTPEPKPTITEIIEGRPWVPQLFLVIGFIGGVGLIRYFESHPTPKPEVEFEQLKRKGRRYLNALAIYYRGEKRKRRKRR